MKRIYLTLLSVLLFGYGIVFAQSIDTFNYTGSVQTYTVPPCVSQITVDVRGAQGMGNTDASAAGGLGGRTQGVMTVVPGQVLDIYVGQGGINSITGGYNGGADGGTGYATSEGGGGGGASDIRVTPYALANRMVVAGGGGGVGGDRIQGQGPGAGGGGGGGYWGGGGGGSYSGGPGTGGTQAAGGTGGVGGGGCPGAAAGSAGVSGVGGVGGIAPLNTQAGPNPGCAGGLGGALIGGTGNDCTLDVCPGTWAGGAGGGGSNYTDPSVTTVTNTQGFQAGNGQILIIAATGPGSLVVTTTQVQPSCGNSNGSITAVVTGGSSPYTYSWNPGGQTNATATGLSAGTYTLIVTDLCSDVDTLVVTLTASSSITATTNVTANENCNGQSIGSATVTATGGNSPYTYSWAPSGGTNSTATALSAGTYTITITDHSGCTTTVTATITQPSPLNATTSSTSANCGQNNGTATVSITGGTPAYTYTWSNGATTSSISGLSAGTYFVTIFDANGCNANAAVTVANSSGITTSISGVTNVLCNGASTGSATVSASGGTTPYTYSWAPAGGTNATATGLSAGIYTVTVTDHNGCNTPAIVIITQPSAVRDSISAISYPKCHGDTGSAAIGVKGGSPGYTFSWAPSGGTNSSATGLSAGNYTVTVTDNHGCVNTVSVQITQPASITGIYTSTNTTCNNINGTATATNSGGTAPYTYLWSPGGQTTASISGLSVGTYTVTVTDNNGCSTTGSVTINANGAPTITVSSITNDRCNGNSDGSATVTVSGGSSPYTYFWFPGLSTTATETGLSAGTYTVGVLDSAGCIATTTVNITQPNPVTGTIVSTSILCHGGNTGTATVTAAGGTTPYTYSWSTIPVQTNATATGLSAGTYTVTITDKNGCTGSASVTLTQPTAIRDSITAVTYPTCHGGTGSATVTASGGTTPYVYQWIPVGQTNATATGLSAGTYTVIVRDNNGCNSSISVTITQPQPIIVTTSTTQTTCGNSNGTATANASGGNLPYTYVWSTLPPQTTATATGLSVGTYTVLVVDNKGCTTTATANITAVGSPTITVSSVTNINCNGNSTGSATVTVSGGVSPYTYAWSTIPVQTTATATGLSAGTYTITVTDNSGCIGIMTVTITQPNAITETVSSTGDLCNGGSNGTATVTASGGTAPYTYAWSTIPVQTTATATGLSAGTYTVTIIDHNGCATTASVTVTQPGAIQTTINNVTYPTCNGATGTATVVANNGFAPYTYSWSTVPVQTNSTATGLSAGTYTVTVTDNHGCDVTNSVTITQPAAIVVTTTIIQSTCGNNNGSATALVNGGTSPYTYGWSTIPIQTTQTATGLSVGTYTVLVADNNGCTGTATATVTAINAPVVTVSAFTNDSCNGGSNGNATVTVSGGTSPYTYAWTTIPAQTTATATGLSAGTYTVMVTDNTGCSTTASVTITQPAPLTQSTSFTGLLCNGATTGTATVTAGGGTAPYTYSWNPGGQTTPTAIGLSAGTYTVIVTDNNGCSVTDSVTVTQPSAIILTTNSTNAGCSNNNGTATVSATGGTGTYTYSWAPGGATTASISGLGSGAYTVTVIDSNGCSVSDIANVPGGGISGSITASTNVSCFGNNNGSATVTAIGNSTPFTYSWVPGGQNTATATGLSEGSYTITVTDNNGCSFTATVTISGPSAALTETNTVTNASCNSSNNGAIALAVSGGTPQYTFTWSNGSTNQNQSNLLPGSYTVSIMDSNGCSLVDSMKVGFDSSVVANAGRDTVVCHNSAIVLNGTGSSSATGYAWYQMPGMVLIKDTSVVFVTPTNDTTTYVLVVQYGTCTDTSSVTIVSLPAITVDPGPDQIIYGAGTVTLGDNPTNSGGTSLVWDPPATLNDSLSANPSATPTVTTIYTVTVKNSYGCTVSDTVTVFVLPGINVPTGFSPNGDGVNDYWSIPFAADFPNIVVEVYNRWGELLFQSNGYNIPWDGTYSGKPLPIGTYYYIINLHDSRFPKALTGPITILR